MTEELPEAGVEDDQEVTEEPVVEVDSEPEAEAESVAEPIDGGSAENSSE